MPLVDGVVVLQSGVGALPRREGDVVPQLGRGDFPRDRAVGAVDQRPVAVDLESAEEGVRHPHAVVGVLAGNRVVGVRVPVGVVLLHGVDLHALGGELQHALNRPVRHAEPPCGPDGGLEVGVLLDIHDRLARAVRKARVENFLELALEQPRTGHQCGDLALLDRLPGDELLDVGVVEIEAHHLGRAAGGAAGLDGAGRAVADLEEGHETRRTAAAGERLSVPAQLGEVGAGSRSVLEQARLAHPQIHDAAFVHQVVGDRLDEAGVRLRVFVGARRRLELSGLGIGVPVALGGSGDAVGPVQPGVEPLRRVGRRELPGEHVAQLVVKRGGVVLGVEVAVLPAPVGPTPGQPVEDLAGVALGAGERFAALRHLGVSLIVELRHARLAEVLLNQDVDRHLGPALRRLDALHGEHQAAVGVADFRRPLDELDGLVRVVLGACQTARDLHVLPPTSPAVAAIRRKTPPTDLFWITGSRIQKTRLDPLYIGPPSLVNTTSCGFWTRPGISEVSPNKAFLRSAMNVACGDRGHLECRPGDEKEPTDSTFRAHRAMTDGTPHAFAAEA